MVYHQQMFRIQNTKLQGKHTGKLASLANITTIYITAGTIGANNSTNSETMNYPFCYKVYQIHLQAAHLSSLEYHYLNISVTDVTRTPAVTLRIRLWENNRSQWPSGLRQVLSSAARTLGSQVRICVVLSCVGRGLASGWSPRQGVLPNV
jgi:hypothetical protein